jgi:hypothetical protein
VNVRSGVAYGFNPTDFFRTESVTDETSDDPSVLRDNRLGTVLIRGQYFLDDSTFTALYSPKMYAAPALNRSSAALDPQLRRTNAEDRAEITASHNFGLDINPEVILFHEGSTWTYGLNATRGFGNQTTAYVEWSGSQRRTLISEALSYGVQTGTLPSAESPLPTPRTERFYNDLAVGLSYTTKSAWNAIVEYDLHQAGFSREDWNRWFAAGTAGGPGATLIQGELWYLRDYAAAQQEPINRQTVFARIAKDDWLTPKLSVSALSIWDLTHNSWLAQLDLDYQLSSRLGVELMYQATRGSANSDFGSAPVANSYFLNFKWYP